MAHREQRQWHLALRGLILSESRDWGLSLTNEDVAEILKRSARDLTRPGVGWDQFTGYGLVNAEQALTLLNPPYSVRQASATGGTTVTETWGPHDHTFLGNSDLPGGRYYAVRQYEVRRHISFCGPYAMAPEAWSRTLQTTGWSAENPNPALPHGEVINATLAGLDVRTYVYYVPFDVQGRAQEQKWWPCPPEQAVHAWTVVGNQPLQAVSVSGPYVNCYASLRAASCGGAQDLVYEWFERPSGGAWSGAVGTGSTYERPLPEEDMEFKLIARSGGIAIEDTHYVNYVSCVIGVPARSQPKELRLTFGPNPARGSLLLGVELPDDDQVTLSVHDLSGRIVDQVAAGPMPAGVHKFEWSPGQAGHVPAGLYFVRMTTRRGERTARAVIVP